MSQLKVETKVETQVQSFPVYKIQVIDLPKNHYQTDRSEHWVPQLDKTFSTLEEAKAHIISQSRIHTDLPNYLVDLKGPKGLKEVEVKTEIINKFCFEDDRYLIYRRYFLGPPPIAEISRALKTSGIHVIKSK